MIFHRSLADAEPFTCAGIHFGMILPRDVTGSVEAVLEFVEPGESTPMDKHATFDQLFFILHGSAELRIEQESALLAESTMAFVPRGSLHSLRCLSTRRLEFIYFNIWNSGIPDEERSWRQIYALIHERRRSEHAQNKDRGD